jgi:peptidase C13-like protein
MGLPPGRGAGVTAFARVSLAALWAAATLTSGAAFAQTTRLAVIVGLAGDPQHAELFQRWAATLIDAAGKLGVPGDQVIYLAEQAEVDRRATGKSTREEIAKAFGSLSAASADDVVFVVLIGHGSFDGRVAKFNLPGPDMTADDFAALLKKVPSRHIVFVNTASASGPFIAALAAPGRTVVTATRNGAERFATLFGGFFVDAFAGTEADADKNRRISVLEAFDYAKRQVATAYEREGIMLTEHPLISDNGDKEGTAAPASDGKAGRVAAVLSLGTAEATDPLPADPKLRALYTERRDIERRIEALKLLKESMDPAKYASELEKLATDLALKTRQIREAEK